MSDTHSCLVPRLESLFSIRRPTSDLLFGFVSGLPRGMFAYIITHTDLELVCSPVCWCPGPYLDDMMADLDIIDVELAPPLQLE